MRLGLAGCLFVLALPLSALAAECNCSKTIDGCSASVTPDWAHQRLDFHSASPLCVQITYSVDGEPGSVTIRGGAGSTDYLVTRPGAKPSVQINSCSICVGGSGGSSSGDLTDPANPRHNAYVNALDACVASSGCNNSASAQCAGLQGDTLISCVKSAFRSGIACLSHCSAQAEAFARSQ